MHTFTSLQEKGGLAVEFVAYSVTEAHSGRGDLGPGERSEASSKYNRRANFLILLAFDPHVLEHRERTQDGGTYPGTVLGIWRGNHLEGGGDPRQNTILGCSMSAQIHTHAYTHTQAHTK